MRDAERRGDRVLELATALSNREQGVFDQPLGVGDACLSPRQVLRVLMGGAVGEEWEHWEHLRTCSACLRNVTEASGAALEPEPGFVTRMLSLADQQLEAEPPAPRRPARSVRRPLPAIVGMESRIVPVRDPSAHDFHLACSLLPAFDRFLLRKIDPESIQVKGAIIARGEIVEIVDIDKDGTPDLVSLRFSNARLSPRVRRGIEYHQRVVDTVQVLGSFKGEKNTGFAGQARLEFVPQSS